MQWKIPGFGDLDITSVVLDYNGTLAVNGKLIPGLADILQNLSQSFRLHVLTGDTYGIASEQLDGLPCELHILPREGQALAKQALIEEVGANNCIAIGNGRNDALMLKTAAIGIAVLQDEGLSVKAALEADIMVRSITDAFSLLKDNNRLIATLRS